MRKAIYFRTNLQIIQINNAFVRPKYYTHITCISARLLVHLNHELSGMTWNVNNVIWLTVSCSCFNARATPSHVYPFPSYAPPLVYTRIPGILQIQIFPQHLLVVLVSAISLMKHLLWEQKKKKDLKIIFFFFNSKPNSTTPPFTNCTSVHHDCCERFTKRNK